VEVVKRWWLAFSEAVGSFLDEAAFRVRLAGHVLLGRIPTETHHRKWNPEFERPSAVHVRDWVTGRHIMSVIVWPPLGCKPHDALFAHDRRVEEVREVIARGCAELAWSTSFEVERGLDWDPARRVWTDSSGFNYEYPERKVS
jgi:hypothetical protein